MDTHICTFFDGVLEEMLERKCDVHHGKTLKNECFNAKKSGNSVILIIFRTNKHSPQMAHTGCFAHLLEKDAIAE